MEVTDREKAAESDIAESTTSTAVGGKGYGLTIDFLVDMPSPLQTIKSLSHPIKVDIDGSKARVSLSQTEAAMTTDFVLLVQQKDLFTPRVWLDGDREALMLELYPQISHQEQRCEFIFLGTTKEIHVFFHIPPNQYLLVDRSGSMAGGPIAKVQNALTLFLKSLPEVCKFNSTYSKFFYK